MTLLDDTRSPDAGESPLAHQAMRDRPRAGGLRPGGLRTDALWVGSSKVASGAVLIGINLWAANYLAPAAYGVLGLSTTLLLLIDQIFGSAVDLAVMQRAGSGAASQAALDPAERAGLTLKVIVGAAMIAIGLLLGDRVGRLLLHQPGMTAVIGLMAVAGVGLLFLRSALVYFQVRLRFDRYGLTDLSHSLLKLSLVAAIVLAGAASPAALLAAYAVAPFVVLGVLVAVGGARIWRRHARAYGHVGALWAVARVGIVTFGVGTLVARLDIFLLGVVAGPYEVGLLAAAVTVAVVPEMMGAYLAPVFTPRILTACREGTFRELFTRVQLALIALSGVLVIVAILLTRPVMSLLVPAEYAASADVALVLIPGALAGLVTFPLTFHFLMFVRPRVFLMMDLVSLPFLVVAYIYAAGAYGALGVAWVSTMSRVAKASVAQGIALRLALRPAAIAGAVGAWSVESGLVSGQALARSGRA